MTKEPYKIEDFIRNIDTELSSVMTKMMAMGFDSINIEITPRSYATMATVDLWMGGINFPVVVRNDGSLIIGREL